MKNMAAVVIPKEIGDVVDLEQEWKMLQIRRGETFGEENPPRKGFLEEMSRIRKEYCSQWCDNRCEQDAWICCPFLLDQMRFSLSEWHHEMSTLERAGS